jgi:ABC-type transport system involved in multi-copper enzyme maturation permease subunit
MSVFLADLRRTTRRGRPAVLRTGYAAALLAALAVVFARWFGVGRLAPAEWFAAAPDLPIRDVASFAREFAIACFIVQVAAVLLITPAFTAGAVAEERQRQTLDDLLITGLSSRRIVFGKLFARWVQLNGVLFAGLPVLAITASWGGVDLPQLAVGFVASALLALGAAALGVWMSIEQRTVNAAVLVAYCITFPGLGQVSIMTVAIIADGLDASWPFVMGLGVGSVVLTGIVGMFASRRLRLTELAVLEDWPKRRQSPHEIPFVRPAPRPRRIAVVRPAPPLLSDVVPSDSDDPLLWREVRFGSVTGGDALVPSRAVIGLAVLLTAPLLAMMVLGAAFGAAGHPAYHLLARLVVCGSLAALAVGATVSSACTVTRERERQTLDGLLTLPGGREAVLRAKWRGVLVRDRPMALAFGLPVVVAVLIGGFDVAPVVALFTAVPAQVAACISLGLYCSVRAQTTTRALVMAGFGLLSLSVVPLLSVLPFVMLSPPAVWWTLTDPEPTHPLGDVDFVSALVCATVHALTAYGLWRLALARFHREADG